MTAHILFVDDEEPNLVVFEAVCGDDFQVLTASNGADGLALMQQHEVGVVLSDQRMPGMTGTELLEKVQADYPDTIRLLITAYSDLQAAEDAINRGHVRRYLRKPWEPESLKAELRDALDIYCLNDKLKALERRVINTERAYSVNVAVEGVIDEIRNPVDWVVNNLDISVKYLETVSSILVEGAPNIVKARGLLSQIEASIGDARMSAARIMELAKSVAVETVTDEAEPIDLMEIVRQTLNDAGALRGGALVEVQGASTIVEATRAGVSQIAMNLVSNAMQSAAAGMGQGVVRISTGEKDGFGVLEVADNGASVANDKLDSIFKNTSAPIGVGLAISKKIANDLKGDLLAESLGDKGIRFTLRLPLSP